uniref:DNA polymerase IV n=1 Tax=candidate division WOR-3 bacterium TaxID=2052148 RepID=A0A7C4TGX4_UNCW3
MFFCIDLDAFFVSVERALNPQLKGKPVIVGALPGERGVVASASYEARKYGIKSGMPISRAYRLCPDALFIRPKFSIYEEFSNRFKQILHHYSPIVEISSIDEAFIDIRGMSRLFGQPPVMAERLKNEIKNKLDLPCSIGIARTKVIAKIACDQSKPDGLILVNPGQEKDFLFPLPVDVLPGIGQKTLEILKNLKINTVGEFFNTPDWILMIALGKNYKVIKSFIEGGDYRTIQTMKSISQEKTLIEDTKDEGLITSIFYQLIESLCQRLRKSGLESKVCTIKLRFSDFKTISRRVRLNPGTNYQQIIYKASLPALYRMLKENKRVRLIGVSLSKLGDNGLQNSIFFKEYDRLRRFNYGIDRIRLKFGFNAILPANIPKVLDFQSNNLDSNG